MKAVRSYERQSTSTRLHGINFQNKVFFKLYLGIRIRRIQLAEDLTQKWAFVLTVLNLWLSTAHYVGYDKYLVIFSFRVGMDYNRVIVSNSP
jgi:hypothetical protein